MALTGTAQFKAAKARTDASRPKRTPRAGQKRTSGTTAGAPSGKPAAPRKSAPAKKGAPSSAPAKKSKVTELAKPGSNPAKKDVASQTGAGKGVSQLPDMSAPTVIRKRLKPHGSLTRGNPRRVLVAEFLVCFIILGAGTIVSPQGDGNGVPRLMSKGTALAGLFLILALTSAAGEKSARAAAGLGGLVTVAYLVTSKDATNIALWLKRFYGERGGKLNNTQEPASPVQGAASGAATGGEEIGIGAAGLGSAAAEGGAALVGGLV